MKTLTRRRMLFWGRIRVSHYIAEHPEYVELVPAGQRRAFGLD